MKTFNLQLFLLLFFFLTTQPAGAHSTPTVDSLLVELSRATNVVKKANIYNQLAYELNRKDPEQAIEYAALAFEKAKEVNELVEMSYAQYISGLANMRLYHYQNAIDQLIPALQQYNELKDSLQAERCNYYLGICYFDMGQHDTGLKYLLASAELAKKLGLKRKLAGSYNEIGSLFSEMGKYRKSIDYQMKSLKMWQEMGDSSSACISYNNLSTNYIQLKDYEKALTYQTKAMSGWEALGQTARLIYCYTNLGLIYSQQAQYNKAFDYFTKALNHAEPQDIRHLERIHNLYGSALMGNNQLDSAIQHFKKAAQHAINMESKVAEHQNYEMLAAVYKRQKNLDSAFHYLSLFSSLRDTILAEDMAQSTIQMEAAYSAKEKKQQLLLKEQEVAMAAKEKELVIFRRNVILVIAFLILLSLYLLYRKEKKAKLKNKQLHEAELKIEELRRENLERDVHFKNKQLISYALQLTQKNDMLIEIQDRLKKISEVVADEPFMNKINQLNQFINTVTNTEDDWEEFKVYYEQVHLDFFKKMKEIHPELSNKELRLCALLNISLATKEIASILRISPKSVEIARYRLRKKLGINREENLTEYINKQAY